MVIPHHRGASTHVREVARHLVRMGHEVFVIARLLSQSQRRYEMLDGFHIFRNRPGIVFDIPFSSYSSLSARASGPLRKFATSLYAIYLRSAYATLVGVMASMLIRREEMDVILERETSFGAGAVASILTGRPLVLEVVGPRCSEISLRRARKILAYSHRFVPPRVPREKIEIVPGGVNTDLFRPDSAAGDRVRRKYGLEEKRLILYVGSFSAWHGVEGLVKASSRVLREFRDVCFLLVGPYYEQAEALAQKLSVGHAFVFTGPVDYCEVPDFINAADLAVAPYDPSGSPLRKKFGLGAPLKLLEYMACQTPVIASSIEPIRGLIRHGESGILVPPGDHDELAAQIIRLLRDKELANSLARMAEREARERYSWDTFCRLLTEVLCDVARHGN